jgi:hypothetical protein
MGNVVLRYHPNTGYTVFVSPSDRGQRITFPWGESGLVSSRIGFDYHARKDAVKVKTAILALPIEERTWSALGKAATEAEALFALT